MIKIITTEDGSHSLLNEEMNETYHSTRGAMGESLHVFIKEGLEHWMAQNQADIIKILEVGLGTGLNAFLTAKYSSSKQQRIHFTALEPFPIQQKIYEELNYFKNDKERDLFIQIHDDEWEKPIEITPHFTLLKTITKLEGFTLNNPPKSKPSDLFDIIYFDAFAPSKQPEVWELGNLKKCYGLLAKGGVLTTYCAQGNFKRNLMDIGFQVEPLQGAMGKKEMVRAIK